MNYEPQALFQMEESLQEASLAKTFPWLAKGRALLESVARYSTKSPASQTKPKRSGSSSKTSLAFLQVSEEQTWEQLLERWPTSGMWDRGGCLTLNTLEFPSDGGVYSSLRDVLEIQPVAPKYYLSRRACEGILRRAERRGKKLPEALERALRSQSDSTSPTTATGE